MACVEMMTAKRADALLTELEICFSGRAFQRKLQKWFDKAAVDSVACSSDLASRRELLENVYVDILVRYGFKQAEEREVEQLVSVMKATSAHFPHLATRVEGVFKALRIDSSSFECAEAVRRRSEQDAEVDGMGKSNSVDASEALNGTADADKGRWQRAETPTTAASTPQRSPSESIDIADLEPLDILPEPVSLGHDEALALQTELLRDFSSPAFQKKLHELARKHNAKEGHRNATYSAAFQKLVREVQFSILPRHGFEASEKGVEAMLAAFEPLLESDQDIFVQSVAIKDALSSACPVGKTVQEPPPGKVKKPKTAAEVERLLRHQLVAFSSPRCQHLIKTLKDIECKKRQVPLGIEDSNGWYRLPGRAEVAFSYQKNILIAFSFEGTREGVQDMITHCAQFLKHSQVASLLDAINEKLGMSPAACRKFRNLAESFAQTQ
eukprot:TRINITY_DN2927_c0_g7_i1.p1 TRINITY_DN2927_c0_g7~~TRINITY_DN2927_c0_g7_i1.p1  ORF type:complete len:441 (-),score=101.61 TRINITY_DN2927_c0_g7_i1:60-1382(-)